MKNLTIALEDGLLKTTRIRAANAGVSMSRYIAALVERDAQSDSPDDDAARQARLEALERFLSGPKMNIAENGRMPTAEQRNARR